MLFGFAVAASDAADLNYRALKGPAALTRGTPHPSWYPGLEIPVPSTTPADSLPDWKGVYSLARKAMRSFQDGEKGSTRF